MLHVGFTGTRQGMTDSQKSGLIALFELIGRKNLINAILHHGDCVGADAEADDIISLYGGNVVIHPPTATQYRAFKNQEESRPKGLANVIEVHKPSAYLVRDRRIVDSCRLLIAAPKSFVETGGTWYTINYAKRERRSVLILNP